MHIKFVKRGYLVILPPFIFRFIFVSIFYYLEIFIGKCILVYLYSPSLILHFLLTNRVSNLRPPQSSMPSPSRVLQPQATAPDKRKAMNRLRWKPEMNYCSTVICSLFRPFLCRCRFRDDLTVLHVSKNAPLFNLKSATNSPAG